MVLEDCPICLDEMHPSDDAHPLQCDHHCGFNICRNCIESFISSSKDDYMEASDGSYQVKVWLRCPNCRSDLSHTIRDTLLLRKVDELSDVLKGGDDGEIQISEKMKKLKDALDRSEEVQAAVADCRQREANYLGCTLEEEEEEDLASLSSDEEWGFEADLDVGIHSSFRMPKSPISRPEEIWSKITKQVDHTLFGGLSMFLKDCDQVYLTELLTSGDPSGLAEAAEVLSAKAKIIRDPTFERKSFHNIKNPKARNLLQRSSVFDLIDESKEAHQHEEKHDLASSFTARKKRVSMYRGRRVSDVVVRLSRSQKSFPLPVRMPKHVEIQRTELNQMRLIDDEWDGTLADAYSKLTIGFTRQITKSKKSHKGVENIIGEGNARIALPGQSRVLISNVPRAMGMQGATRGDVLTHIQGVNVSNKTVAEIEEILSKLNQATGEEASVSIVFNAELSIAEALKRRAFAKAL